MGISYVQTNIAFQVIGKKKLSFLIIVQTLLAAGPTNKYS